MIILRKFYYYVQYVLYYMKQLAFLNIQYHISILFIKNLNVHLFLKNFI